jgi:hypothetical protein
MERMENACKERMTRRFDLCGARATDVDQKDDQRKIPLAQSLRKQFLYSTLPCKSSGAKTRIQRPAPNRRFYQIQALKRIGVFRFRNALSGRRAL